MDASTFDYLKPTDAQLEAMQRVRAAFMDCADVIGMDVPEGPDKTHALRVLRTAGMWANVAITRQPDGTPRS